MEQGGSANCGEKRRVSSEWRIISHLCCYLERCFSHFVRSMLVLGVAGFRRSFARGLIEVFQELSGGARV